MKAFEDKKSTKLVALNVEWNRDSILNDHMENIHLAYFFYVSSFSSPFFSVLGGKVGMMFFSFKCSQLNISNVKRYGNTRLFEWKCQITSWAHAHKGDVACTIVGKTVKSEKWYNMLEISSVTVLWLVIYSMECSHGL